MPKAQAIIDAWNETDRIRAGFSLGFDYLYMPVYSTTIALACVLAAGVLKSKAWRSIGVLLAWGLWIAAIFDAIENVALFTELLRQQRRAVAADRANLRDDQVRVDFGGVVVCRGRFVMRLVKKINALSTEALRVLLCVTVPARIRLLLGGGPRGAAAHFTA